MLATKRLLSLSSVARPSLRKPLINTFSYRTCSTVSEKQAGASTRIKDKWLIAVGGSLALILGGTANALYNRNQAPLRAFERGNVHGLPKERLLIPLIPMEKEVASLKECISASACLGKYVVMVGEHNSGKTTLIEQAYSQEGGCVYISVGEDTSLVELSAPFVSQQKSSQDSWYSFLIGANKKDAKGTRDAFALIERGAIDYANRTNRQPVLIIANINSLDREKDDRLAVLHKQAVKWAKEHIPTVVFVASTVVPSRLRDCSRSKEYFVTGDVPESVAVKYLSATKGLDKDTAGQVVRELTGNRLPSILDFAVSIRESDYNKIQDTFSSQMKDKVYNRFNTSNSRAAVKRVVWAIMNSPSKSISYKKFHEILETAIYFGEWTTLRKSLDRKEIFSLDDGFVTFSSPGMQRYLEKAQSTFPSLPLPRNLK